MPEFSIVTRIHTLIQTDHLLLLLLLIHVVVEHLMDLNWLLHGLLLLLLKCLHGVFAQKIGSEIVPTMHIVRSLLHAEASRVLLHFLSPWCAHCYWLLLHYA